MGFNKIQIFAQNPYVLAYGFTENRQFATKTNWNSIFLHPDPHILDRLYIMVPYMSSYGFWKISKFPSKSIGVSLRFYQKSPICNKNRQKLCISWSLPSYCGSVIYNGLVYELLQVLKIKILLKYFTKNCKFMVKTDWNSIFLDPDPHISNRLYIMVLYMSFYRFLKKIKFSLKICTC
jgi:hypothetical protein